MLEQISLGVYYPGTGLLHRLQARTKLLMLLLIMVVLIIANQRQWHFAPYVVGIGLVCLGTVLASVSARTMWRRTRLFLFIILTGVPFVVFASESDKRIILQIGPLTSTYSLLRPMLFIGAGLLILLLLLALPPLSRRLTVLRGLKRLRVLFLIVLLAIFFALWLTSRYSPSAVLTLGPWRVTYTSVWTLVASLVMLVVLYISSMLLTMTTLPVALIEGMSLLLAPLRHLRLPVDDFALMTLLALRFIPTLLDEANQLIKAQMARGASLTHGTVRERFQSLTMFFIPLVQGTLRRAGELSVALEARGYRADGRQTFLHETRLTRIDYAALATVALIMIGSLVL